MTSSRSPQSSRCLTLEVWLGPMEGVYCTSVFEADPYTVRIGRRYSDERRGIKNDLVLSDGDRVSGFHAEVRFDAGRLFLKDLNSTNGTYAGARRVSGEVEVKSGDVFLVSTTPIQILLSQKPKASNIPGDAAPWVGEINASAALQKFLEGVRTIARARGDGFADTRHLVNALLRSEDPAVIMSFSQAKWPIEEALRDLWTSNLFGKERGWILPFLESPAAPSKSVEAVLTARVNTIFGAAARRLAGASAAEGLSQAGGALLASLLTAAGPIASWLADHQIETSRLATERRVGPADRRKTGQHAISKTIAINELIVSSGAVTSAPKEQPPRPARAPGPPEPRPVSTGDVLLDQRARAIAQEIEAAAVMYRFSTPEDRRAAIKSVVTRSLAAVAPENRGRILSQIRVQFPIIATTLAPAEDGSAEVRRLKKQVEDLERRIADLGAAEAKAVKEGAAGRHVEGALESVFATLPGSRDVTTPGAVLHELVDFARAMEKFLLGLIQNVTMPGSTTTSFTLPGYRQSLESMITAMRRNKPVDMTHLPEYLRELERWQVAILAGHHAAAGAWFRSLWSKISPTSIEAASSRSATWKLQGGATDSWNRYREAVKGLTAEVVQDQILLTAYRIAQEEYDKLTKRRAQ